MAESLEFLDSLTQYRRHGGFDTSDLKDAKALLAGLSA